ncbi:MAG: indole-3-glycerol phosphate synthase TrpC [Nanoarchaeota archaeon]|nr:indole-3-glycerol phosphate synthase TrpC [Nanoarchaeota archaeon]
MKKTNTILDKILSDKALEVEAAKKRCPLSYSAVIAKRKTKVRDFLKALGEPGKLRVMAEIKKASPSAGLIRPDFDHMKIAAEYQASGLVDAISILTENKYFQGKLEFIREIKEITTIPLFRKDFIFDEYQIYESYSAEADALLLIAAALEPEQLKHLLEVTHSLGLQALVETHSREEIEMTLSAGAKIIGINARDLKTFEMRKDIFSQLAQYVPKDCVKVAESGLEDAEDVKRVYDAGANAVLIGTSIMKAKNIKEKIQELVGI